MEHQNFCLKWESFQSNVTSVFEDLRQEDELVDITLCCEGERFPAHRMMLSACSPYFRDVLKNNTCQHMMFYMKDTSACDLRALVEFIYKGCVNVSQNQLPSFIKLAESLQIRGLSGDEEKKPTRPRRSTAAPAPLDPPSAAPIPPVPRPRSPSCVPGPGPKRARHSSDGSEADRDSRDAPAAPSPQSPAPALPGPSYSASPGLKAESVKVEKVDLTEDDEDGGDEEGSLEATLGQVAEYEGFDGSGQAMFSTDFHQHMLSTEYGGEDISGVSMSSQSMSVDDANSKVFRSDSFICRICGREYYTRNAFLDHMKLHQGLTVCEVCQKNMSTVSTLRIHLRRVHGWSHEQVLSRVPRQSYRPAF